MASWKQVDQLVGEQKYEAASDVVMELLATARERHDEAEITRALIKETQLRLSLHGYETAVRFLQQETWPEKPLHRLTLQLFYGQTLATYLDVYGWEIAQREEVAGKAGEDLESWTAERIEQEVESAYAEAWRQREAWGGEPIGELAAYLDEGTYPARIRGTLRDTVSYLWVNLLSNTSRWRPEASTELYRLDLEALLADASPYSGEDEALRDPKVHPLEKIRFILADLEAWQTSRRQPEAAFEARLELLRQLRGSFSDQPSDLARLRAELESRLEAFDRGLPWWSMGMSLLAEMQRDTAEDPMRLVAARDTAREGATAHPDSVGGQRCRHLAAALEQPRLSFAAMAVDGAARRSLELTHANVKAAYFRAYTIDPLAYLEGTKRRQQPDPQQVETLLRSAKPTTTWKVALPATPDLQSHRTFATPQVEKPGAYIVVSSLRSDFADGGNVRSAAYFILSDLVLTAQVLPGEQAWELTARHGKDGRPLGVDIDVYRLDWRQGHRVVDHARTKTDGTLRLDTTSWASQPHVIVARLGEHLGMTQIYGQLGQRSQDRQRSTLIYTDRSVYRPGQEVLWKVVAYEGADGRFKTLPDSTLEVELTDANGETVAKTEVHTNDFGSASGQFTALPGRLLGGWSLSTSWGGYSTIKVEEYKRPTFEIKVEAPTEALRLNHPVTLRGVASYYFGLPVSAGEVRWHVTREPIYPPWRWWQPYPTTPPRVIAHGEGALAADGSFEATFTPEADERLAPDENDPTSPGGLDRDVLYSYRLSAEVTDDGGETRDASRAVRIGFVAVDAELEPKTPYVGAGEKTEVTITRRRLDGAPAAGDGSFRVTRLIQPESTPLPTDLPAGDAEPSPGAFETEGDRLRPRWNVDVDRRRLLHGLDDGAEVTAGTLHHGENGEATLALDLPAGAYRLHYSTVDDFGAEVTRQLEVLVAGKAPLALPALLVTSASSIEPGGKLDLLVHSGFADQPMLLEMFHGEKRLMRRSLKAGSAPQLIEVPVTMDERGGFGVTLTVLRDHQLMRLSETVEVPWIDRGLEVSFEKFRDKLTPGAKETFTVVVKSRQGTEATVDPRTLELLAYMYDRSLDLFAPHTPPRPLSLYPNRISLPNLQSNLGQAPIVWGRQSLDPLPTYPPLRDARLRFFDGWPIGGPGRGGRGGPVMQRMMVSSMPSPPPAPMAMMKSQPTSEDAQPAMGMVAAESIVLHAEAPMADVQEKAVDAEEPLRSDFAETAFWMPHLRLGENGAARLEFTVPDSVTEWSVWAHALTEDLRSGSIEKTTRSAKDLLLRPYLPRFLREGDRAELRLVISNAGEGELQGTVDVALKDPETGEDRLADFGLTAADVNALPFRVEAGATTTLTVSLDAPRSPMPVAVEARARAGELSDGERRPLPILPSRLHLAQSRFTTLQGIKTKTLRFADLAKDDDPSLTSDALVVTLDGQLFGSVLRALPYLVDYPYQCTEQSLNRYLSTGILSRLYDDYPSVRSLGARLAAERDKPLEVWDAPDPNRQLLLEETPWLRHARGGDDVDGLLKVLDPKIAEDVRAKAVTELKNAQTASGGFPWWPGGPPSPYMTLYVLQGFARGLEFGLDVPKDETVRAWAYLETYWREELSKDIAKTEGCCAPQLTFLSWLLWAYPDDSWTGGVFTDDDRQRILDLAERDWKQLSPRLKGYLALALERAGRVDKAHLVWDSVMDSAKTEEDLGTFWAPEDRAWLWYNDTVETHAFALRVLMSLDPADARRHGLVQWLLLDKKLGHWKSTRATAEAVFSLAAYMSAEGTLGQKQSATVDLGGQHESYVFEPEEDGHRQLVIEGEKVTPAMATIEIASETKGFLFASATWHFATDRLPEESRGDFFNVKRSYFRRVLDNGKWILQPLDEGATVAVGDQVEVKLDIKAKHAAEYVHLRDPRGAGFEPEDTDSGYSWQLGVGHYREIRDSAVNYFFEWLPAGEYTFRYRLRATTAGTFRVGPAELQSMYAPEFVAYSAGREIRLEP